MATTEESLKREAKESGLKWLWLAAFTIALDQWTKYLANTRLSLHEPIAVLPSFNLSLAYNKGAAFSFLANSGSWSRWFFVILTIVALVFLLRWLAQLSRAEKWLAAALSLILGGAVGNLIDRLLLGHVVDFIQVYYQDLYWPTFNVADSAITVGAVMSVVMLSLFDKSSREES